MNVHARVDTVSAPEHRLRDTLERAADLRWQAALAFARDVRTSGGIVRFVFADEPVANAIRLLRTPVGEEIVFIARDAAKERQVEAVPAEVMSASVGESIIWGYRGSEDLWRVGHRYRLVGSVPPEGAEDAVPALLLLRVSGNA